MTPPAPAARVEMLMALVAAEQQELRGDLMSRFARAILAASALRWR